MLEVCDVLLFCWSVLLTSDLTQSYTIANWVPHNILHQIISGAVYSLLMLLVLSKYLAFYGHIWCRLCRDQYGRYESDLTYLKTNFMLNFTTCYQLYMKSILKVHLWTYIRWTYGSNSWKAHSPTTWVSVPHIKLLKIQFIVADARAQTDTHMISKCGIFFLYFIKNAWMCHNDYISSLFLLNCTRPS
jgi:hypothetical protein